MTPHQNAARRPRVVLKTDDALAMQTAMFDPMRRREFNAGHVLFDLELPTSVAAKLPLQAKSIRSWRSLSFDMRGLATIIRHDVLEHWPEDRLDYVVSLILESLPEAKQPPNTMLKRVITFRRPNNSFSAIASDARTNTISFMHTSHRGLVVELERARIALGAVVPTMLWIANALHAVGVDATIRARGRAMHGGVGRISLPRRTASPSSAESHPSAHAVDT